MIWLLAIYVLIVLFLAWAGLSDKSYVAVDAVAKLIPSIQSYAALSPNAAKATLELTLAWVLGLAVSILMLPAIDWDWVNRHADGSRGPLKTGILLLATGAPLLALALYPDPPSGSRQVGRLILSLLRSDLAVGWGVVVIVFAALGVTSLFAGLGQICRAATRGKST